MSHNDENFERFNQSKFGAAAISGINYEKE